MNDQLQMEPLETAPFAAPDQAVPQAHPAPAAAPTMEAPAQTSGPVPDFFSEGKVGDPLMEKQLVEVPPAEGQLDFAATIYTLAGGGRYAPVTQADVLKSLEQDIDSETIQFALDEIKSENEAVQREMILQAIQNPRLRVDAKLELVAAYDEAAGIRKYDVNRVQREALTNILTTELANADTPEEENRAEVALFEVEDAGENIEVDYQGYSQEELYNGYAAMLNAYYSEAEESSSLFSRDFLATMIPFRFNVPIMQLYAELGLNDDTINTGASALLPGEALKQMREYVETLDAEGKTDALQKMMRILKPNSGVFSDGNDFVTMHMLSEIFYKDLTGNDYYDDSLDPVRNAEGEGVLSITQFLDNVGGILDLIALGGLAKAGIKLGVRALPKSMTQLNRVSPKTASEIAASILNNPALAERLGGTSALQWAENILPSHRTLLQDGGVNGVEEIMAKQVAIQKELQELAGRTSLTMQQRADALSEIEGVIRNGANAQPSALHPARTHIEDTGSGISIRGVFGRDSHHPFNTLIDAKEAAKLTFNDAPIKLLWEKGGKLVEVPAGISTTAPGRFFFEVADERAYDSAADTVGKLVFGASDVSAARWTGKLWNYIRNPGSVFSPDVNNAMSVALRERYVWSKLTESLTTTFNSLSRRQQQQLSAVLKEGERIKTSTGRGTTFTTLELASRGLGDDAIKAYYEARGAMDILHNVTNARTRAQYQAAGLQQVQTVSGSAGFAAPRLSSGAALADRMEGQLLLEVFDPVKKVFVRMTETEVHNLYGNGASLARLKTPMLGKGAEEASHIIVDSKAGTQLRALPRQVLNKVEGYYPHMWDSNFVVYGKTKGGNRIALGLARTAGDAKAAVSRIVASKKGQKFAEVSFDFDRSLRDPAMRGQMIDDIYLNLGGPVYGERSGGLLKNFSRSSGDHAVDPLEAMVRGMELVGQQVTKGELVQHMRTKLQNFLAMEGIGLKNPRMTPRSADDLVDNAGKAESIAKARTYLDQIDMFSRTPDAIDEVTSFLLRESSLIVERILGRLPGANTVARALADKASKGFEPFSWLNSFAHKTIIATAPVTHLALQSLQSMVMLGISPRGYFSAMRQFTSMATLFGMRTFETAGQMMSKADWDKVYKTHSKLTGIPVAELEKLTDVFYKSGLIDAVSHNSIIRQNLRSAAEARRLKNAKGISGGALRDTGGRIVRGTDEKVFGTLAKIGFEAGENINQMMTFLSFYNADRKAGVAALNNADYVRSLIGRTAEVSGNMVPEMGFKYQRGWFKTALQFVSFQHKMLLMMLPEAIGGSRALTGPQKAGIILSQFLLYGRRGVPYIDAFYRVVNQEVLAQQLPPDQKAAMLEDWAKLRPVMDGFLMDLGANYVLKELYGEQTPEFGFGERLAPGGGTEFMIERLWALAQNPATEIFGMGGQKVGKLADWADKAFNVALGQAQNLDYVPINERAQELAESGAAVLFSQYNKILAVQAARTLDGWVTAGGNVSQGYSGELEGNLFKLFGVNTKERDELYLAMDKYQERFESDSSFRDNELRETANKYYQDLIFQSLKASKEAPSDQHYDDLMDRWVRERNLLFSMMDKQDAARIHELVSDRIISGLRSKDSAEQQLVEKLTRQIRENQFGSSGPEISSYLMQQDFVKNNPQLLNLVHDAFRKAHDDVGE